MYDIFISYKRISLPTANNLYYRLSVRGYSTFFDLEELGRDNFDVSLLSHIENAKDVFVILEENALDGCKNQDWEKDWFCYEIAHALEKGKNIIPILLNGYQMPPDDFFPTRLKQLSRKHAPEFNFSYFDAYLDRLIEKNYLLSKPRLQKQATSAFKFYSNENCHVFKEGKLVCSLEGMSEEPYYLPVSRKGDYRFKVENLVTKDTRIIKKNIDADEEKEIDIVWEGLAPRKPRQERFEETPVSSGGCLVGYKEVDGPVEAECVQREKEQPCELMFSVGDVSFKMVRVEGGLFTMGASTFDNAAFRDEYPQHEVCLSDYCIGETPVTQAQWKAVMGGSPSMFKGGENPVERVSWNECRIFIKRLNQKTGQNFRLPTEAEWEYAARGGKKSMGYRYPGSNIIDEVAWYKANGNKKTHPVKGKKPNELGLYDMGGNVWEWCADWYDENYYRESPKENPQGPSQGSDCVLRGCSWLNDTKYCRVSCRSHSNPDYRHYFIGFRLALCTK